GVYRGPIARHRRSGQRREDHQAGVFQQLIGCSTEPARVGPDRADTARLGVIRQAMIDRPLEAFTSSMPPAARACLRRGGGVACSFANPKYHPAGVVYCPALYSRSAHRSPGGAVAAAAGAAAADAAAARAASSGAPLQ